MHTVRLNISLVAGVSRQ